MRIDEDKDYKLKWRKAMDELVNLRQEYRELKEDRVYIKSLLDAEFKKGMKLKKENEQLKKAEKINMEYAEQIVKENKKLRIAKNDLRIENEQLRKELDNFKPVMFQDMRKGTVILYSKVI